MSDSKPALHSVTLWLNVLLPIAYLLVPGLKEALPVEAAVGIIAAINAVIRVFKTNKGIEGVI